MRRAAIVLAFALTLAPRTGSASGERITGYAAAVNRAAPRLPLGEGATGAAVVRVQVLLDAAFTSPGIIDGRWSRNTTLALQAFQERHRLRATGALDRATLERLRRVTEGESAIVVHVLSPEDVRGPFVQIPPSAAAQARLECLCYRSLAEKLGERFHASPDVLRRLNPGVELDRLSARDRIRVPRVRKGRSPSRVAQIVVHRRAGYLRALDARGRTIFHAPATVGAPFARSPGGTFHVSEVAERPTWRGDDPRDASTTIELPPGPNSPVGIVWIGLSKPGYGIHGTDEPERIAYSSSHGCVRLTNWDALLLAHSVRRGVPVRLVE